MDWYGCAESGRRIMYRFFVEKQQIDTVAKKVTITGSDVNHIRNVLRMEKGEEVSVIADGDDNEYRCAVGAFTDDTAELDLLFIKKSNVELPCEITLYQALPKSDKMELVITKSVELGASRIVPVATKRAVVKLDAAGADRKQKRWAAISEAAAKQSKRAVIPEVGHVMTMAEAIEDCRDFEVKIIPYELADPDSMDTTRKLIGSIRPGDRVAVFIGPEGGFTDEEIELATKAGFKSITLGRRILRTETAGPVVLSWLIYDLER